MARDIHCWGHRAFRSWVLSTADSASSDTTGSSDPETRVGDDTPNFDARPLAAARLVESGDVALPVQEPAHALDF
jgi:hypothetical protein